MFPGGHAGSNNFDTPTRCTYEVPREWSRRVLYWEITKSRTRVAYAIFRRLCPRLTPISPVLSVRRYDRPPSLYTETVFRARFRTVQRSMPNRVLIWFSIISWSIGVHIKLLYIYIYSKYGFLKTKPFSCYHLLFSLYAFPVPYYWITTCEQ